MDPSETGERYNDAASGVADGQRARADGSVRIGFDVPTGQCAERPLQRAVYGRNPDALSAGHSLLLCLSNQEAIVSNQLLGSLPVARRVPQACCLCCKNGCQREADEQLNQLHGWSVVSAEESASLVR